MSTQAAPPIQIHHGNADTQVPYAQSVEFVAALRSAGGDAELVTVEGSNHFWIGAPDLAVIFDASLAFALRVSDCLAPRYAGRLRRSLVGRGITPPVALVAPDEVGWARYHATGGTCRARRRYVRAGMTSLANMRIDRWVSSLLMPG